MLDTCPFSVTENQIQAFQHSEKKPLFMSYYHHLKSQDCTSFCPRKTKKEENSIEYILNAMLRDSFSAS